MRTPGPPVGTPNNHREQVERRLRELLQLMGPSVPEGAEPAIAAHDSFASYVRECR